MSTKLEALIYDRVKDIEARNELLDAVRRIASLEAALDATGRNLHEMVMGNNSKFHSGKFDDCESVFCRDVRLALKGSQS
jgi:hypothetical protein